MRPGTRHLFILFFFLENLTWVDDSLFFLSFFFFVFNIELDGTYGHARSTRAHSIPQIGGRHVRLVNERNNARHLAKLRSSSLQNRPNFFVSGKFVNLKKVQQKKIHLFDGKFLAITRTLLVKVVTRCHVWRQRRWWCARRCCLSRPVSPLRFEKKLEQLFDQRLLAYGLLLILRPHVQNIGQIVELTIALLQQNATPVPEWIRVTIEPESAEALDAPFLGN
jgi:hypothetical protein